FLLQVSDGRMQRACLVPQEIAKRCINGLSWRLGNIRCPFFRLNFSNSRFRHTTTAENIHGNERQKNTLRKSCSRKRRASCARYLEQVQDSDSGGAKAF